MCKMCDLNAIRTFVTAGDAIFTLSFVGKSGEDHRYTYRLQAVKDRETGERKLEYFAKLLSGPDNTSDYSYMGMVDASKGFWTTKASKLRSDSLPARVLHRFVKTIYNNAAFEPGVDLDNLTGGAVEFRHIGKCGRCGRPLTVPESIDRGIGPDCAEMMGIS